MKISQTLRRPANWQDFETLCMMLWEELWQCPEIKKNGRSGQMQDGVDIYGIPKGEDQHYGIQCKGKSEYNNSQFTESEILCEVEKAKKFRPSLKKLYLATTAPKDVNIEKVVRELDINHRSSNLFEVHLFSWEDIVERIDRTQNCKNWYLNGQGYQNSHAISFTFSNLKTEFIAHPIFNIKKTKIVQKIVPADPESNFATLLKVGDSMRELQRMVDENSPKINLSYMPIDLILKNDGTSPVESFKIHFEIDGDIQDLRQKRATKNIMAMPIAASDFHRHHVEYDKFKKNGAIQPRATILIGGDSMVIDTFYIKPFPRQSTLKIKWKFLSTNYRTDGELKLIVVPEIKTQFFEELTENPLSRGITTGPIEDFFENIRESQ